MRDVHASADVVHLDSISLAGHLPDVEGRPTLMTHHGAESFMIRRRIGNERSLVRKAFFAAEWLTLRRAERLACPRVGVNVVMSDLDGEIMQAIAPASYRVVENGVGVDFFQPIADTRWSSPAGSISTPTATASCISWTRPGRC